MDAIGVTLLRALVVIVGLLGWVSSSTAGLASLEHVWPQGKLITVCFLEGSPEARTLIVKTSAQWTEGAGIAFDFGKAPAFDDCTSQNSHDVRIGFRRDESWSYVGKEALQQASPKRPTMVLALSENPESAHATILHEFGHALGLLNAEQDPQSHCREELDRRRLSSSGVDQSFFDVPSSPSKTQRSTVLNDGRFLSTGFDLRSIMRTFTDPQFFRRGTESPCFGPPVFALSEGDHHLIQLLYPPKPADVIATLEPKQLIMRFEGVLAPEHFGFFLSTLYDAHRIAIRKYPARGPQQIRGVMAAERLVPRGVSSESVDMFLCDINPHICTRKNGEPKWRNVEPSANYREDSVPCGNAALDRSIFCIPNVRLEPYASQVTLRNYNGARDSIQDLAKKYRSCEKWDKDCRTLIRRLNRHNDVFSPKWIGEVTLPSEAYRLVLDCTSEEDRDALYELLNKAIDARAQSLKVSRENLAIQLTYPMGNPRVHAVHVLDEPAQGYVAPLKVMAYPFDDQSDGELFKLPNMVQVGIWDTRVDVGHCELKDLSVQMLAPENPNRPPVAAPPATANCGESRPDGYNLSLRYDHATAVAGIIAAKINSIGTGGIIPGVQFWTWEVLDGNQFQADDNIRVQLAKLSAIDPRVINVSQTYPLVSGGKPTQLENVLFGSSELMPGLDRTMLFVAAAGMTVNEATGEEVGAKIDTTAGSQCSAYPACWSNSDGPSKNLISVVALDGNGTALLKDNAGQPLTNYGLAFDVGAVGESTAPFHGGWSGRMVGSSVAAPYVTGLAALILAEGKLNNLDIGLAELKQRILFTADDPPSIRGLSRYGRIDMWKALAFKNDLARRSACTTPDCWQRIRIDRKSAKREEVLVLSGTRDGVQVTNDSSLRFHRIRSLARDQDDLFTVVYAEDDRLRRIESADIRLSGKPIVRAGGNPTQLQPFSLDGLREYTACSFYSYCRDQ